ncbi:MAG TPA: cation:proton antiporter [Candidatus Saccharimonadales bacterium]|jgi:Kef-type K+ transport system membrane component KefB
MDHTVFIQLSFVLALAALLSLTFKYFRQPLVIAYILTGFLAGPSLLNLIHDHEAFSSFSQIGIALLLFVIGLGLNAGIIRATGKPVLFACVAIIAGVGSVTFLVSKLLGFGQADTIVLSVALLFSSTIIVITSLSDKKEQSRLYGQIAIGILLVEDIAATLALLFVSSQGSGAGSAETSTLVTLLAKGAVLAAALIVCGGYLLPRTVHLFAKSQELLYIFALAWAFGVASVFYWYGFSMEVGALFAGVCLAHMPYAQEISVRLKPLRDFFLVLFFVELGQNLNIDNLSSAILPAIVLSAVVMIVKPLTIISTLGLLGYTKQTGFKTAVHLSQISEFSIVLVALAVSRQVTSPEIATIVTLTAIITIVCSTYLMKYDDVLYKLWQKPLSIFERGQTKREIRSLKTYPLVLLGYRKGGYEFLRTFRQMKKRYIVIDYDPEVIEHLERQHASHLYGDVTDLELLNEISLHNSELVVSTIADMQSNLLIISHIMGRGKDTIFVCHASTMEEALLLYDKGASYVLLPHYIGSEQASGFIQRNGSDKAAFDKYREQHLSSLAGRQ